jgi:hypothetical protein
VNDAFRTAQARGDEIDRKRSNQIRGLVDIVDPQTKQTYKVESGSKYYWVDSLGRTVGTDTNVNPDPGRLRQAVQRP